MLLEQLLLLALVLIAVCKFHSSAIRNGLRDESTRHQ